MTNARETGLGATIWREITLRPGEQLVVNGALVSVRQPCAIRVGAGAVILSGRALWSQPGERVAQALYYKVLTIGDDPQALAAARKDLFAGLARVLTHQRRREGQEDCSAFAAALLRPSFDDLLVAARSLARREADAYPRIFRAAQPNAALPHAALPHSGLPHSGLPGDPCPAAR